MKVNNGKRKNGKDTPGMNPTGRYGRLSTSVPWDGTAWLEGEQERLAAGIVYNAQTRENREGIRKKRIWIRRRKIIKLLIEIRKKKNEKHEGRVLPYIFGTKIQEEGGLSENKVELTREITAEAQLCQQETKKRYPLRPDTKDVWWPVGNRSHFQKGRNGYVTSLKDIYVSIVVKSEKNGTI
jgi:hypothetical protein